MLPIHAPFLSIAARCILVTEITEPSQWRHSSKLVNAVFLTQLMFSYFTFHSLLVVPLMNNLNIKCTSVPTKAQTDLWTYLSLSSNLLIWCVSQQPLICGNCDNAWRSLEGTEREMCCGVGRLPDVWSVGNYHIP